MSTWDNLSMSERAEVMKLAIQDGVYDLDTIRNGYNEYAKGGSIHINPENKGKFTALKKRTGHSASWFKAHGTPAQRKMATFALNSRKWKHEDGGYLNLYDKGGNKNSASEKAMKFFVSKGLARHQAAGLVGNLMRESNLNPDIVNKSSGAYGIAQWLGDRKKKLFSKYGNKPTLDQQLDYIWEELNSTHKTGLKHLLASKDAEEAARMGMGYYEFSAGPEAAIANMNKWGQNGEASMRKGILNANQLMSIYPPTTGEIVLSQAPKGIAMPTNPAYLWNMPSSTYVSSPSVATPLPTPDLDGIEQRYNDATARRQERIQKINVLSSLMNLSNQNNSDGYFGLENMLNAHYTNSEPLVQLVNSYAGGGDTEIGVWNWIKNALGINQNTSEGHKEKSLYYRNKPAERKVIVYSNGSKQEKIVPKRIRKNISSTQNKSEAFENGMRMGMMEKQKISGGSNPNYDIMFDPNKAILIGNTTTSTNALDTLAKYAAIHNANPKHSQHPLRSLKEYGSAREINMNEMLGLPFQETSNGAWLFYNTNGDKQHDRELLNSNYFTAFGYAPADNFMRNFHYNDTNVDRDINPVLDAYEYFAQGDYNTGDPNHTRDVNNAGKFVWSHPKVKEWWNTDDPNAGKNLYNYWYNQEKKKANKK